MDIVSKSTDNISRKTQSDFKTETALEILSTHRLAFRIRA